MATVSKVFFRGAASTSSATLYTVPAATTAVITNIIVSNKSGSNVSYDILLDDIELAKTVVLGANDTITIDLKQVLGTTKTIKGLATSTDASFHISGVEIT